MKAKKALLAIALAGAPLSSRADSSVPSDARKAASCAAPAATVPPQVQAADTADDEGPGHVVVVPARKERATRRAEPGSLESRPVSWTSLPARTTKREARTNGGPLDFVDDVIDAGELVSRVAAPPPIKLAPAPRLPKPRAPQSPPSR